MNTKIPGELREGGGRLLRGREFGGCLGVYPVVIQRKNEKKRAPAAAGLLRRYVEEGRFLRGGSHSGRGCLFVVRPAEATKKEKWPQLADTEMLA